MSTKKRFSIAPDLASGIRNTIQSASTNQGQLHYDMMSLDAIQPDPENPRKLSISHNEMVHGLLPTDPDYQKKIKERDALNELSESIKRIGIRNAIEVYKDGLKYRIVTGERRYWAAMLAGQKSVPVRISPKPEEFNLRYTQWVENINRQDLSLAEKLNNLILISEAHKSSNRGEFSEQALQNLLGISTIQAYRYFALLNADDKVIQLVNLGKINNLKLAQELCAMKDQGARNQVISWIRSSKDEVTSLVSFKESAGKKAASSTLSAGRSISLGKINNAQVAKKLFEIVLSDIKLDKYRHEFKNIDWSSSKAITKAFKSLFKSIELALSVEDPV